jgi:putative FmdB family regulatory protein
MAIYEYFCPTCREKFEARRPMAEANVATKCKAGHRAERTISMFAMSVVGGGSSFEDMMPMGGGGGCCGGGGCACSSAN